MNGFKKRSILPWKKSAKKWLQSHLVLSILILILAALGIKGVVGAINLGNPFSVKQIVISAVSEPIETDKDGHTNILLLGVGGEGHDGGTLTDTMIVASVDYKNNLVPMLSIPRDIYVDNEMVGWGTRINSVYEYVAENNEEDYELGMQELVKEIEDIAGLEIHYYAKIDFSGFIDVVDAIGGVTVDVEEAIYDPFYPAEYSSAAVFQTFQVSAGLQEMDGETALKYARSRQSTSDFDRAHRQQQIINAIKDQALSAGFLLNPVKIKNTIAAVSDNFETNMTLSEMLNFANLASDFNGDSMVSAVLNDDPSAVGGILYAPPREEYGGAYVLVPYTEDYDEIHQLAEVLFHYPEIYTDQIPIQILNGTGTNALAGFTALHLMRLGFNVIDTANSLEESVPATNMFATTELNNTTEDILDTIQMLVPGIILNETPEQYSFPNWDTDAEIIIELGEDYLDYYEENDKFFYYGVY